jgi:uncharacterized membrane protein YdjX (TVP38/TMEM64 family)
MQRPGIPQTRPKRGQIALALAAAGLLAASAAAFAALRFGGAPGMEAVATHRAWVEGLVAGHPLAAPALFVAADALALALAWPAAILMAVMAGLLFGTLPGAACSVVASTLGAVGTYAIARTGFAGLIGGVRGARLDRLRLWLDRGSFNTVLVLRLTPVVPFCLVNLAAGLLALPLRSFVAATMVGLVPASLIYAGFGSGLSSLLDQGTGADLATHPPLRLLAPLLGLALLASLPLLIRAVRARTGKAGRPRP